MKKRVVAFILVGLLAGVLYWGYQRFYNPQESALTASGTIEVTKVELSAKLPGTIGAISVVAGDKVKKGQLVGQIIRNDLVAQKERDALGVLKTESQLKDLNSGARVQEIKEASANVNVAQASYEKALADYERGEKLFQAAALPQEQLEKLQTDLRIKENQLASFSAKLSLLEEGNRPDAIKAAQIEMERARAILKASEALLADTKIFSPVSGIVLSKNQEPGEFVQAGVSLVTVADLNDMWIRVYVPTDDLPKLRLGQEVYFTVSGSNDHYAGQIEEIASQGEYTPKTIQTKNERTNIVYAVKIRVTKPNGTLKPGMPADVVFQQRGE
ncbi:secretion protein HlyD family protein [Desulforamulus reducens MI-1]|uniref:Secretion protein HlyD family protein n=1 Tax=Desulforamulus reducens (strain ATCC BAA-1160 / DSM 100696 / MI-1) TaxID=349161 RepID=A4J4W1_DESRM|nr:HlyD family efflux transporter periplasmic adaptor subunit [Desulforamulus reducens]ABO50114.1 secretion protein HlyD family protein [Desulforamulus reducens MI-1]